MFGVGVALRVITQIAYRPALLFIDSYRYLDLLDTLDPTRSQTLGYDFFVLWPLLKVGNLFLVALVQHAPRAGDGRRRSTACACATACHAWLAAAAAAPILLDAYQLQIEQNIMSETIFEALLVGAMLALLWHRRPTTRALVIGGVLLGLAVPVRIVALPLVVPAMIFAFVSGPGGARRLGRATIVAVAFLVPIAGYMTYYRSQTGTFGLTTTDAHATFGRAAQIADCDTLSLTPVERRLCPPEPLGHRRGVNYYAHHYPVRRLSGVTDEQRLNKVLRDFARHVFRQQPLDLAHAVATDFLKGFRWRHTNAHNDVPVERWQFQTHWVYNDFGPVAVTREFGGGPPTIVKPLASFLRSYQLTVGYTPGTAAWRSRSSAGSSAVAGCTAPAGHASARSAGSRRSPVSASCSPRTCSSSRGATSCPCSCSPRSRVRSASPRSSATPRRRSRRRRVIRADPEPVVLSTWNR